MNGLKELIESERAGSMMIGTVRVVRFDNGVLNLMNTDQSLTQIELDSVRSELKAAGYRESESWIASQGASWLNSGLFAGVSMRVVPS